jgi:hypothetical protein
VLGFGFLVCCWGGLPGGGGGGGLGAEWNLRCGEAGVTMSALDSFSLVKEEVQDSIRGFEVFWCWST